MTTTLVAHVPAAADRESWLVDQIRVATFVVATLMGLGAWYNAPIVGQVLASFKGVIVVFGLLGFVLLLLPLRPQPIKISLLLLGHLAFMALSLAWSTDPANATTELIRVTSWGAVALLAFTGLDHAGRRTALLWFAGTVIVTGLLTCVLVPSIGVGVVDNYDAQDFDVEGWRAMFIHKNPFGITTAISAMLVAGLSPRRWIRWTLVPIACFSIWMSQSATALSAVFAGMVVLWVAQPRWQTSRSRTHFVLALTSIVVVLAALSTRLFELVLDLMGKDATLTGRTDIWKFALTLIEDRPFVGYGLIPFGSGGDLALDNQVRSSVGFVVNHAHNGAFQLLLQGGLIGALPVVLLIAVTLRQLLSTMFDRDIRWAVGAVTTLLVASGSESVLSLPWIILLPILTAALPPSDGV